MLGRLHAHDMGLPAPVIDIVDRALACVQKQNTCCQVWPSLMIFVSRVPYGSAPCWGVVTDGEEVHIAGRT